jgi:hypothetical protein
MNRKEQFLSKAGITEVVSREQLKKVAGYYDANYEEDSPDLRHSFFPCGNNKVGLMYCKESPSSLTFKSEKAALEFKKDFEPEIFKYLW